MARRRPTEDGRAVIRWLPRESWLPTPRSERPAPGSSASQISTGPFAASTAQLAALGPFFSTLLGATAMAGAAESCGRCQVLITVEEIERQWSTGKSR